MGEETRTPEAGGGMELVTMEPQQWSEPSFFTVQTVLTEKMGRAWVMASATLSVKFVMRCGVGCPSPRSEVVPRPSSPL